MGKMTRKYSHLLTNTHGNLPPRVNFSAAE